MLRRNCAEQRPVLVVDLYRQHGFPRRWRPRVSVLPPVAAECTMPFDISFQPMRVLIDGHDSEGYLILADNHLAAVIVRLDGETHAPEHKGQWYLEAGFGKCNIRVAPLFKTPDEAGAWVEQALMHKAV
jgi:hypothetical protein